jgi:hypothetical protein
MICGLIFVVRECESYLYRTDESLRKDRKTVDNSVLLLMRVIDDNQLSRISCNRSAYPGQSSINTERIFLK